MDFNLYRGSSFKKIISTDQSQNRKYHIPGFKTRNWHMQKRAPESQNGLAEGMQLKEFIKISTTRFRHASWKETIVSSSQEIF
jgi:hypothetical protein